MSENRGEVLAGLGVVLLAAGFLTYAGMGRGVGAGDSYPLMASFRMTNRASQSHEGAIAMHRAVYDAIQRGQPEEARQAMQALIGLARQDMNRSFG